MQTDLAEMIETIFAPAPPDGLMLPLPQRLADTIDARRCIVFETLAGVRHVVTKRGIEIEFGPGVRLSHLAATLIDVGHLYIESPSRFVIDDAAIVAIFCGSGLDAKLRNARNNRAEN